MQVSKPSTLPSRRELREALLPFSGKSTTIAVAWVVLDYSLFLLCVGLVATPTHWLVKVFASVLVWLQIARLFIIGHDACHQSLTQNRALNKWLGRLVFMPSLTPFKLWEIGHNMAHHGFTNLRGKDYVWRPLSVAEFAILSPWHQRLERYYRSGWGCWLYYLLELWWRKLYFPARHEVGGKRGVIVGDCLLVSAFALVWVGGLAATALHTGQSMVLLVTLGFALPFLLWNGLMGFVIYVHHTDPKVSWYAVGSEWAKAQPHITATVHIQFPGVVGALLHNIMEHPAHHLDMTIPLYRLKAAQRQLVSLVPHSMIQRRFSWVWYRHCNNTCQLFDYEAGRWTAFPAHSSANMSGERRQE